MVIELLKAVLFGIVEGITEWLPISSTGHLILLNQFVTLWTFSERSFSMVIELLKAVLFGIVEGITEWLPISSTGHLILLNQFVTLEVSDQFQSMFDVVIQLGAILAVIVIFFHKLNPFSPKKSYKAKKATWDLWFKVIVAIIPSGIVGILLDDWMDAHLHNATVVSIALIVYGIAFIYVERMNAGKAIIPSGIVGILLDDWMDAHLHNATVVSIALIVYGIAFIYVERMNAGKTPRIGKVWGIDYKTALLIGAFQCLSLIPGTSRSGSTILGAIILGVGRSAASEFSFFMAIPTMVGASGIKLVKFLLSDVSITGTEVGVLIVGTVVSFLVSMVAIRALMAYVRKHSFSAFGVYRIVLSITGTEVGVLIVGTVVSFLVSMVAIRALMAYVRKHSFSAFGVYRIVLGALVLLYFLFQ